MYKPQFERLLEYVLTPEEMHSVRENLRASDWTEEQIRDNIKIRLVDAMRTKEARHFQSDIRANRIQMGNERDIEDSAMEAALQRVLKPLGSGIEPIYREFIRDLFGIEHPFTVEVYETDPSLLPRHELVYAHAVNVRHWQQ